MNAISREQLIKAIDEIHNPANVAVQSSEFIQSKRVGTLLGWSAAIGILAGALMQQIPFVWVIGVAAIVGVVLKLAWPRMQRAESGGMNEAQISVQKQVAIVRRFEQSDPIGSRFMAILREVLDKNGITPKAAMAMIDDVAHERRSISEAFYTISAVLKQVDNKLAGVNG